MEHRIEIRKKNNGEYVTFFMYNKEAIFWTEGY